MLDYKPFNQISYPYNSGHEILIELKLIHDLYPRVYLNAILHLQANQITVTQAIYISDNTKVHAYIHIHRFKEIQYLHNGTTTASNQHVAWPPFS